MRTEGPGSESGEIGAEMLSLDQAKELLSRAFGSSPDDETLLEWLRFGQLTGNIEGKEVSISEESIQSLIKQIENRRPARLVLKRVELWRRKLNHYAVAITMASPTSVVTSEHLCKNDSKVLLEGSVQATLLAVNELIEDLPPLKFLRAKQDFLEEVGQSVVTVLVHMGEGDDLKTLPGIAKVNDSNAVEAASRATLNALNRNLVPYMKARISWRDLFKKIF
jgi:hypothetical protein